MADQAQQLSSTPISGSGSGSSQPAPRLQPSAADSAGAAAFDLQPMRAPCVSGVALRVAAWLAESPITGGLVAHKFLDDAGVLALRRAAVDEPLPHEPAGVAAAPSAQRDTGVAVDLAQVVGAPAAARDVAAVFETAADFRAAYLGGSRTPAAVADRVLTACRESERQTPAMRFFIAQHADDVMAQAEASTARYRDGKSLGPLDGVPIAVKDEFQQAGYVMTAGMRMRGRQAFVATEANEAEIVRRLRRAGAVLIGKANMQEIGLGVTGINAWHGAARNPYDPMCMTGGSSSGSAAVVAAGLCPIAVGADGGGSIRIPASLCGVVGFKATFGRISGFGSAGLCWSVGHEGPLAATIDDAILAYAALAGADAKDALTLRQPVPSLEGVRVTDLRGIRIGIFEPWFDCADRSVVRSCREAVAALVDAGGIVVPVAIPELALTRSAHLVSILVEMAASQMAHGRQLRHAYGYETRLTLAIGRRLTGADYVHAQRLRRRLSEHFRRAFEQVDVLVTPATATTAPRITDAALGAGELNPAQSDAIMRFAPPANLTGYPAIALPVGYDEKRLPVGLQAIGRPWEEHLLLRVGSALQARCPRQPAQRRWRLLT